METQVCYTEGKLIYKENKKIYVKRENPFFKI